MVLLSWGEVGFVQISFAGAEADIQNTSQARIRFWILDIRNKSYI